MKKYHLLGLLIFTLALFQFQIPEGAMAAPKAPGRASLDAIIRGIENRYGGSGFSAVFQQESTLKAMEITDFASGHVVIKRPGKMRWEYIEPEKQTIITDGSDLWVFRPEDNQVMIGKAPDIFGNGKGAGFLSDIGAMAKGFNISLEKEAADTAFFKLKLLPKTESMELIVIYLHVSMATSEIVRITTINFYGDETKINLSDQRFDTTIDDGLFKVDIPKEMDIIYME